MTTPTIEARVQEVMALIDEAVKGASYEYVMNGLGFYPRERNRIQGAIRSLAASATQVPQGDAEALARRFHDLYEQLAPQYGYETRPETRVFDPQSANGKLMIAVCAALAQAEPQGLPDMRPCTCHPDDNPPRPCPRKFALNECRQAATQGEAVAEVKPASNWFWQHIRSGREYVYMADAKLQTDTLLNDMADVVVYRGADGKWWVRGKTEFGLRFERTRPLAVINEPAPAPSKEQTP